MSEEYCVGGFRCCAREVGKAGGAHRKIDAGKGIGESTNATGTASAGVLVK